ncbi:MAG TPA: PsiF family protein, partial [Nitrospiraceae bacterium]|nr:PsiF family protein [Nitrospiraceae bacterium]
MYGWSAGVVMSFFVLALAASPPVWAQGSQQTKMKTCNAEAGEKALKGDERKAFMKSCLSAKPA